MCISLFFQLQTPFVWLQCAHMQELPAKLWAVLRTYLSPCMFIPISLATSYLHIQGPVLLVPAILPVCKQHVEAKGCKKINCFIYH